MAVVLWRILQRMATTKVTFTLDQATISRLQASTRMTMQSEVVRNAIAENYDRMGRLSESERLRVLRVLRVLDDLATHIPTRSDAEWTGNYGRFVGPAGRADTVPVCEPRLQRQPLILMVAR
jgi:hypothetical protein